MADPVEREMIGIKKVLIHEQWGAPMDFHRITRVEHDLSANQTYVIFNQFYNKQVAENGGLAMASIAIMLPNATLSDEATLLKAVIDEPDSIMKGGTIERTASA